MNESHPLVDDSQWRVLSSQLVAIAHLIDYQREHGGRIPLDLASVLFEAASATLSSFEAVVAQVGRTHSGSLSAVTIDALRTAYFELHNASSSLADLVPELGRGDSRRR